MVQKVSSLKAEGLSPSDYDSHPEEKEISDDDDDDRNHKHRRREEQSQSMEKDPVDQVSIRPNRKRNKPFENGNPSRENASEHWKKRPASGTYPRGSNRDNQSFSGDFGPGRGRGKEISPWIHRDPRFSSVLASQMVLPGPVPPNMFAGRGLGSISNTQGASWNPYGLIPGVMNGGMDPLHPLGLQGALRPLINPPLNMGIMRQRCRDFEERGFCLRGDMCPMEHGVNRIVVEDVQSLSQFNLPVSLPSGHPLGSSSALTSVSTTNTTMNGNSLHRSGKSEMTDGGSNNGVSTVSVSVDASDFYDPDQPLWAKDCPGTSTSFQGLNQSKFDETEFCDTKIEHHDKNNATAVGPQGETVWGRVGSKNKSETKGKFDSTMRSSHSDPKKAKPSQDILANFEQATTEGKMTLEATHLNTRRPIQKALRTLFVSCIPKKDNNIEALLSHFKRFGEVIDIYIPHSGDRAFVQFSKKEEAEGALKAPDAVMGNRFIKLLWATRDRITEDVPSSTNSASLAPRAAAALQAPPHHSFAHKGKDNLRPATLNSSFTLAPHADNPNTVAQKKPGNSALLEEFRKRQESFAQKRDALQRELAKLEKKASGSKGEVASEQVAKRLKGVVADSEKAEAPTASDTDTKMTSPQAEAIAYRAKTEAVNSSDTGTKMTSLQAEAIADSATAEAVNSSDSGTKMASPHAEVVTDSAKAETLNSSKLAAQENCVEISVDQITLKPHTTIELHTYPKKLELHEVPSSRHSIRPLAPPGAPFSLNRFKLDNRPSAFRIPPPLPTGLENIDVLKEHFSAFGEISSVELEDGNSSDQTETKNCSAIICFSSRRSAERAFVNGKCWQGHTLQLIWMASSNSSNNNGNKEKPSASEISTTISAESGNLVTTPSNRECVVKGEDVQSSSSSLSPDL